MFTKNPCDCKLLSAKYFPMSENFFDRYKVLSLEIPSFNIK